MKKPKYADVLLGLFIVCAIALIVRNGRMQIHDCWTKTPTREAQALWQKCQDELEYRFQQGAVTHDFRLVRASEVYAVDKAKVFKVEFVQVPADAAEDVALGNPMQLIVVMKGGQIVCYPGDRRDGPFSDLFN